MSSGKDAPERNFGAVYHRSHWSFLYVLERSPTNAPTRGLNTIDGPIEHGPTVGTEFSILRCREKEKEIIIFGVSKVGRGHMLSPCSVRLVVNTRPRRKRLDARHFILFMYIIYFLEFQFLCKPREGRTGGLMYF